MVESVILAAPMAVGITAVNKKIKGGGSCL